MTERSAEQILAWGVGLVEYWANPVALSEGAREWFATFFLPSAKRCEEHPRFFGSVSPDVERKLRCLGEVLRASVPSGSATAEDMERARQAMVATMGGTILCDPPPKK